MAGDEATQDEVRLDILKAQPPAQIDEAPRASRGTYRLVKDIEEMLRAFPGSDSVSIDMSAAIDYDEVEQLLHQIENRADGRIGNQFAIFDLLGRRQQVDTRGMLAKRGLE